MQVQLKNKSRMDFLDEAAKKLKYEDWEDVNCFGSTDDRTMVVYHAMNRYSLFTKKWMKQKEELKIK